MVSSQVPWAAASPVRKSCSHWTPIGVVNQLVLARLSTAVKGPPVSMVPTTPGIRPSARISAHRASSSLRLEMRANDIPDIFITSRVLDRELAKERLLDLSGYEFPAPQDAGVRGVS